MPGAEHGQVHSDTRGLKNVCVQSGAVPTSASAEAGPGLSTAATFVACIVECWSWGGTCTAPW